MTGAPTKGVKSVCRCEARIVPAILDGYACGNPDCWRTAEVQASFDAFVQKLQAQRGDAAPSESVAPLTD